MSSSPQKSTSHQTNRQQQQQQQQQSSHSGPARDDINDSNKQSRAAELEEESDFGHNNSSLQQPRLRFRTQQTQLHAGRAAVAKAGGGSRSSAAIATAVQRERSYRHQHQQQQQLDESGNGDIAPRQHYFSFAGNLVAVPHYGKAPSQGTHPSPEDDNPMLRRRALLRRMVNTVGSDHSFDGTTAPSGSKNGLLRQDWEVASETRRESLVWLKPSSSPYRKPSLFFSRSVVTEQNAPAGSVGVPVWKLGRALPLFKVTSPSCEYFALRLPLLKGGFKRVADAESFIDANVMWGKSWALQPASMPTAAALAAALRPTAGSQRQRDGGSSSSNHGGGADNDAANATPIGFDFCKRPIHRFQKINHFAGSHKNLGCKSGMAKNLQRLSREPECRDDPAVSDFVPKTFRLPEELFQLQQEMRTADPTSPWIIKPSRGSCGRGIRIFRAGDEDSASIINEAVQPRTRNQYHAILNSGAGVTTSDAVQDAVAQQQQRGVTALIRPPPFVVQQYVAKPLLVNTRKFDFRVYVVVTSFDPLVAFIHHSGLVRFAARSYDSDVSNVYSHLTNYSVGRKLEAEEKLALKQGATTTSRNNNNNTNNNNDDDDSTAAGSSNNNDAAAAAAAAAANNFSLELKWSMERFNEYVVRTFGGKAACDKMWSDVEDVIVKTLFSAQPEICRVAMNIEGSHDASVELYGFDVMLDETLKPWLIEVNTLPSLESSSQFDYNVKSNVVTDMMNLAQLQLFDRHPDVFAHVEQQALEAHQQGLASNTLTNVNDNTSIDANNNSNNNGNDATQNEQQQQQQVRASNHYLQPPHPSVAQYVHSFDALYSSDEEDGRNKTNDGSVPRDDSDLELLLRRENSNNNQGGGATTAAASASSKHTADAIPAAARPRDRAFMGRQLPTEQDCVDTVARVHDELHVMGGFRLMFPTQDKVQRLGKFCSKFMRDSPRNAALWRDVEQNAAAYAQAGSTKFPRWVQGMDAGMDSDHDQSGEQDS